MTRNWKHERIDASKGPSAFSSAGKVTDSLRMTRSSLIIIDHDYHAAQRGTTRYNAVQLPQRLQHSAEWLTANARDVSTLCWQCHRGDDVRIN
jgi:hypothetical protein